MFIRHTIPHIDALVHAHAPYTRNAVLCQFTSPPGNQTGTVHDSIVAVHIYTTV
jgi:hypothetical protein